MTSMGCQVDGSSADCWNLHSRTAAWTFIDLWKSALSCSNTHYTTL